MVGHNVMLLQNMFCVVCPSCGAGARIYWHTGLRSACQETQRRKAHGPGSGGFPQAEVDACFAVDGERWAVPLTGFRVLLQDEDRGKLC